MRIWPSSSANRLHFRLRKGIKFRSFLSRAGSKKKKTNAKCNIKFHGWFLGLAKRSHRGGMTRTHLHILFACPLHFGGHYGHFWGFWALGLVPSCSNLTEAFSTYNHLVETKICGQVMLLLSNTQAKAKVGDNGAFAQSYTTFAIK